MRKKFFNGKRVLALTLALSLVVGEAGIVVAAPSEETGEAAVVEVVETEAEADEELAEETVSANEAANVQDAETDAEDAETEEPIEAETNFFGMPSKVIGLTAESGSVYKEWNSTTGKAVYAPTVEASWNQITSVENVVLDGHVVKVGYQVNINDTPQVIDQSSDVAKYTMGDVVLSSRWSGFTSGAMAAGVTASVKVRAFYYWEETDAQGNTTRGLCSVNGVKCVGEWSDVVKVTLTTPSQEESSQGYKEVEIGAPVISNMKYTHTKESNSNAAQVTFDLKKPTGARSIACYLYTTNTPVSSYDELSDYSYEESNTYYFDDNQTLRTDCTFDDIWGEYAYAYIKAVVRYGKTDSEKKIHYVLPSDRSKCTTYSSAKYTLNLSAVTGLKSETTVDGDVRVVFDNPGTSYVAYIYEQSIGSVDLKAKALEQTDNLPKVQQAILNNKVRSVNSYYGITDASITISLDSYLEKYNTPYVVAVAKKDRGNISSFATVVVSKSICDKPYVSTYPSKNSVKLYLSGSADGYEVYRKALKGTKKEKTYRKIATTADNNVTDTGLKANTKYQYKVRAYCYNKNTKKKIYSDYTYAEITTDTSANGFGLKATEASKTSIKLQWKSVKGAVKYEIYKSNECVRNPLVVSKKVVSGGTERLDQTLSTYKYEKVKSQKKTSYVCKKLTAGDSYSFIVIAYMKDGSIVSDTADVNLSINTVSNIQTQVTGNNVKLSWDKDASAKGYEVRYQTYIYDVNGRYTESEYKYLKLTKTSVTIPGQAGVTVEAAVRAYDSKGRYTSWSSAKGTYIPKLGTVTNIKAVDNKNGTVKITWSPVAGAAYYKVYRTTKMPTYYETYKAYRNNYGNMITKEANDDESEYDNHVYYDEYVPAANVSFSGGTTGSIVATQAVDAGLFEDGATYYYTVVAYTADGRHCSEYVKKPAKVTVSTGANKLSIAAKSAKGKVNVSFKKISGATGYVVLRSTKKSSGYEVVGTVKAGAKKAVFTDKSVKKKKTYYYKVVAQGANGLGADYVSAVKSVKVK